MTMLIMQGEFTVQYSSQQHDIPEMIAKHVEKVTGWPVIRAGQVRGEERRCYVTLAVDNVLGPVHQETLVALFHELLIPFGPSEEEPSDVIITVQETENLLDE